MCKRKTVPGLNGDPEGPGCEIANPTCSFLKHAFCLHSARCPSWRCCASSPGLIVQSKHHPCACRSQPSQDRSQGVLTLVWSIMSLLQRYPFTSFCLQAAMGRSPGSFFKMGSGVGVGGGIPQSIPSQRWHWD